MKDADKKKGLNNKERKSPRKLQERDPKLQENKGGRKLRTKETSSDKPDINKAVGDLKTSEVLEDIVVDYMDDANRSGETMHDARANQSDDNQCSEKLTSNSSDMEIMDESDSGTINGSVSSNGDSQTADDESPDKVSIVPKEVAKENTTDGHSHAPRSKYSDSKSENLLTKTSNDTPKDMGRSEKDTIRSIAMNSSDSKNMKVHPKPLSNSSEGSDDKSFEQEKAVGTMDETSGGANILSNDDGVGTVENEGTEDESELENKIEEMESRIQNLECELREVAALEIALYHLVPEHGSSAHKVHTPARRLSRLYIYACKYWSQDRRASVARNSVSGLVLVAKSCGNDVSRLTFWLSNTVVLREIISQAFASSCQSSSLSKAFESNGGRKKSETRSLPVKWKSINGSKQLNKQGFLQFIDDWQETRTFTASLEKVESWIFSRIVESIWWQTLTPSMQSPDGDSTAKKSAERVLGPALGDRRQGCFSINHWENAFLDALKRLCPVRAARHECGCLPVLERKVMEQCIGRLDVAMFNAILRESAHEIPTDPVSDPIVDSKILPIPAGDLSFGSGAQLKNAVGRWTRWLSDFVGMDDDNSGKDEKTSHNDGKKSCDEEQKCFPLLNALSDLLMLPKDMLMDKSIRMEVCPSISLPLVKRISCNFTPDEFCPDPVPSAVLEALNAECIIERRLSGGSGSSFPYTAAPVVYTPPSSSEVAEKVSEAGPQSQLSRSASTVQRKGYTSDEELDEVECCLFSIIDKSPSSPPAVRSAYRKDGRGEVGCDGSNARYDLLREVWQATD